MGIRTLIVEDNPTVRRAMAELISADADLEVVGLAGDALEGVERARELQPQVALVDVRMPHGGGPRAAVEMLKLSHPPRVVAMSASRDREAIVDMLRAGAVGYLVKGGPRQDVCRAIKRAQRGEATVSPSAAGRLFDILVEELDSADGTSANEAEISRRVLAVIEAGGPEVAFQPIFDLRSGELIGYEALARFSAEPVRGPLQWFAEANQAGLGRELELAAVRAAIAAASDGQDLLRGGFLAVNASPATVVSGTLELVLSTFDPSRLVVEITEHARIDDYEAFNQAFSVMRDLGVRLAIDDVGAGYASLRHILQLDPDLIKLDLSLTRGIGRDRRKRALAAALITFAAETESTVVAEGIETERELSALIALGADCGQGYHLGRPGPLAETPRAFELRGSAA